VVDLVLSAPVLWRGPVPVEEPETTGYWQALRDHQLSIQRCATCDLWIHYPLPACPSCGGEVVYTPVSGTGAVYSYTVVNREFGLQFELPYLSAYVELDEGVRLATTIVDCELDQIQIGTPVQVAYHDYPEQNLTLAFFTPAR
jgi:uncharacterized protein